MEEEADEGDDEEPCWTWLDQRRVKTEAKDWITAAFLVFVGPVGVEGVVGVVGGIIIISKEDVELFLLIPNPGLVGEGVTTATGIMGVEGIVGVVGVVGATVSLKPAERGVGGCKGESGIVCEMDVEEAEEVDEGLE